VDIPLSKMCHKLDCTFKLSGSQSFSDRVPLVGPALPTRTTLFQEKSIYQISFDHKRLEFCNGHFLKPARESHTNEFFFKIY